MEELAGEEAQLRRRPRWWLYASIAMLLASAGLVVSMVIDRNNDDRMRSAVTQVLDIVDTGYRTCVLGGPVTDADLGPKLVEAEFTGALTASKVYACRELAQQKLAALEALRRENHPKLDGFWDEPYFDGQADDFGVCSQLELARSNANDLGVAVPPPHCAVKIEALEPTQRHLPVPTIMHRIGDEVVLDEHEDLGVHVVRRTRDGTSWRTADGVTSYSDLEVSTGGVWAYEEGRIAVLDGDHWRQGVALPKNAARIVSYRRTATGWTMLWQLTDDDALVWRLDPMMTKVLASTSIPSLHKRWTDDAKPLGTITADGTVGAMLLRRAPDTLEIEAHVVHPDGAIDAPRITRLPARSTSTETDTCHALGASYFAIEGAGSIVTRDGGLTFTVLRGGDAVFPEAIACGDHRLIAAGNGHLMICDQAECRSQVTPHRSGKEFSTRVAMVGESARILVDDYEYAALFRADPGGAPAFVRAWRWSNIDIPALVRAEDTWFIMD